METKAPAAASPPPAPAAAASSPKKAQKTPVSTPAPTGDKTDSESVPSTPAGAKDENKNKKPRNRNKKPSHPKKDVAAPADAAEEGKVDKPKGGDAAAAENKSEKKPRNRPPKKQQPKKEDDTADENKNDKDSKDEDKNTKPKNKNKNKNHNKNTNEEDKPNKIRTVKGKNTEVFEPMSKPVDLRITFDLGSARDHFTTSLTSRDVLLAPNVFNDYKPGELYAKLLAELTACGIPEERLLKMWHGNEKIDGTHLIADDKTRWKANCPTFQLVIDRIAAFFKLNVQATRFNWYKDTSQWKPFHFDAAAVKPEIAAKQNFTVGVSFGATRDAAFEHAKTRTVVSVPQPDGCVYAFARDTNVIWRHGILQDAPVRQEGRISVIAWGWIDGMVDAPESVAPAPVTEQTKLKKKKESTN